MTFKEQLAADLSSVFFPSTSGRDAEFEETRSINGADVACILDETDTPHTAEGVTDREFTLVARAVDLTAPVIDQRMTIGDRKADVVSVNETDGLLTIRLRWLDS